jgi:preprotein translocase subunit YajC
MTKKDYIAIAKILKARHDEARASNRAASNKDGMTLAHSAGIVCAVTNIAHDFAQVAIEDNPRFDAQRFYQAAGLS